MITLYGMGSPNVVKIRIMLEEVGLPYVFHRIDVINGDQFTDAFGELNPNRKVPVIVDARNPSRPITIFESGAILLYLAETSGCLWPSDLTERYRVVQWLMVQMTSFGPMSGQAIHFTRAVAEPSYARTRFVNELKRLIGVVERQVSAHDFIAGDAYSLADIAFYPWFVTLARFFPEEIGLPAVRRWMTNVGARPAIQRAAADAAELTRLDMATLRTADPATLDRYFGRTAPPAAAEA